MKEAKVSEVKNQLSRFLALVRRGEVVRILDRDVPVAQIVPITEPLNGQPAGQEALRIMERKGLIRRGSGKIPRLLLEKDPSGPATGALDALLDERRRR